MHWTQLRQKWEIAPVGWYRAKVNKPIYVCLINIKKPTCAFLKKIPYLKYIKTDISIYIYMYFFQSGDFAPTRLSTWLLGYNDWSETPICPKLSRRGWMKPTSTRYENEAGTSGCDVTTYSYDNSDERQSKKGQKKPRCGVVVDRKSVV